MDFHGHFPLHRRNDPRRRAEARVYDLIAATSRPGYALYECKAGPDAPGLDFVIWMEGVARFTVQVKGGDYSYSSGRWYLDTRRGEHVSKNCPLAHAWDASMAFVDAVQTATGDRVFVVPVIIFPDTEPDVMTRRRVEHDKVHALWRGDDVVEEMVKIAAQSDVWCPPGWSEISREFAALTGDQMRRCVPASVVEPDEEQRGASGVARPPSMRAEARPAVTIRSVGVVNLYLRPPFTRRATEVVCRRKVPMS